MSDVEGTQGDRVLLHPAQMVQLCGQPVRRLHVEEGQGAHRAVLEGLRDGDVRQPRGGAATVGWLPVPPRSAAARRAGDDVLPQEVRFH